MKKVDEERKMEIRICLLMQVGGDSPRVHSLVPCGEPSLKYKFYRGLGHSIAVVFIPSPNIYRLSPP